MRNFIKEEKVFVLGVVLLTLLIASSSYAEQRESKETAQTQVSLAASIVAHADPLHVMTSTSATGQAVSVVEDTPTVPTTAPRFNHREREYDDD